MPKQHSVESRIISWSDAVYGTRDYYADPRFLNIDSIQVLGLGISDSSTKIKSQLNNLTSTVQTAIVLLLNSLKDYRSVELLPNSEIPQNIWDSPMFQQWHIKRWPVMQYVEQQILTSVSALKVVVTNLPIIGSSNDQLLTLRGNNNTVIFSAHQLAEMYNNAEMNYLIIAYIIQHLIWHEIYGLVSPPVVFWLSNQFDYSDDHCSSPGCIMSRSLHISTNPNVTISKQLEKVRTYVLNVLQIAKTHWNAIDTDSHLSDWGLLCHDCTIDAWSRIIEYQVHRRNLSSWNSWFVRNRWLNITRKQKN